MLRAFGCKAGNLRVQDQRSMRRRYFHPPFSVTQTDLLPWGRGELILPSNQTLSGVLQQKGVSRRRSFIKFCTAMAATLALPPALRGAGGSRPGKGKKARPGVAAIPGSCRQLRINASLQSSSRAARGVGPPLLEKLSARLLSTGFEVLMHCEIPAGDGGLSLGQAIVGAYRFG